MHWYPKLLWHSPVLPGRYVIIVVCEANWKVLSCVMRNVWVSLHSEYVSTRGSLTQFLKGFWIFYRFYLTCFNVCILVLFFYFIVAYHEGGVTVRSCHKLMRKKWDASMKFSPWDEARFHAMFFFVTICVGWPMQFVFVIRDTGVCVSKFALCLGTIFTFCS